MKKKILSLSLIMTLFLFVSACSTDKNQEFYIASNGSSSNKGTKANPFSSPDDAKNAIRQLKKENRLTKGSVTVWLREGIYELPVSFSLSKDDSGTENGIITYSAYPGEKVVISGGRRISFGNVKSVSPETAKRIANKEAIPRIMEIDLAALGISDYGTNQINGFRRPYTNAAMELFINGRPCHLARYPNQDEIRIKPEDVIDSGQNSENDYFPGKHSFR